MSRSTALCLVTVATLAACAAPPAAPPRALGVAPAPVSFDGHVTGQATDYVFVLVPDANPATPGIALRAGEALRIAMPAPFKRNPQVAVRSDADTNLVLTKGWPQGGVRLAGQYSVSYDASAHTMVVKAIQDVGIDGANAPGIKVIHLRGKTFQNPAAGDYAVTVTHAGADGAAKAAWQGRAQVLAQAPDMRLAPTNFHLPPGTSADFQRLAAGQVAPHPLGLLLWGRGSQALNGVGVAPRDLARFPRYTGGLLVQDSNGDKRLDPATDTVVGGIIGAAPKGATGQAATSPAGADGKPVLSGEVVRHAGFPAAGGGGKPNPGLLTVQFRAGSLPGLYRPTFELIGSNAYQYTVEVPAR